MLLIKERICSGRKRKNSGKGIRTNNAFKHGDGEIIYFTYSLVKYEQIEA